MPCWKTKQIIHSVSFDDEVEIWIKITQSATAAIVLSAGQHRVVFVCTHRKDLSSSIDSFWWKCLAKSTAVLNKGENTTVDELSKNPTRNHPKGQLTIHWMPLCWRQRPCEAAAPSVRGSPGLLSPSELWSLFHCACSSLNSQEAHVFRTAHEVNLIFKDKTRSQGHTVHVFIEDEIEKLNKSILVLIQEDAGNAGVHFFH